MIKRQNLLNCIRVILSVGYYLLIAFPLVVSAAQVTLQWNPNEPLPEGYNLYQRVAGQAYNYSSPVNPAGITGTTYTIDNLPDGTTYFFVVRAFLGSDESADSNEVEFAASAATPDADSDGFVDAIDAFPSDPSEWFDTDSDGIGNNADLDDDGDGMPDTWEALYGLNPLVNDASADLDADGISNLDEYDMGTDPSQFPGNNPPDQPLLAEPADGAIGVDLMPILMTEAFFDADQDEHARSRFQIALGSNWDAMDRTDYVFDGEFSQQLTSLTIGDLVLDSETTYYWRVKFYDEHNGDSGWSQTWHFTTTDNLTAGYPDDDGDGILNEQEVAAGNINPALEATDDMLVIESGDVTNPQLALAHSSSADVVALRATDADTVEIGSSANRPAVTTGMISFKLRLLGNATTASMTVHLSAPAPVNAIWYKYHIEQGWIPYPHVTFSGDRKSVTIYLEDGGAGDDDGVLNGVIVDPSGLGYSMSDSLGYSSQISNVSSNSDSSGAGCFIAVPVDDLHAEDPMFRLIVIFGLLGVAVISRMVIRK